MAKHSKHSRRKVHMGSLAGSGLMGDVLPSAAGVGAALAGAIAIRSFVQPTTPGMANLIKYAPLASGALGGLGVGAAIYYASARSSSKFLATAISAALSGTLLFASEQLMARSPATAAAVGAPALDAATTRGLQALTAEIRRPGMQGVVMEPLRGDFGDTVNADAPMRGAFNPSAFGRPQSAVG